MFRNGVSLWRSITPIAPYARMLFRKMFGGGGAGVGAGWYHELSWKLASVVRYTSCSLPVRLTLPHPHTSRSRHIRHLECLHCEPRPIYSEKWCRQGAGIGVIAIRRDVKVCGSAL